MKLFGRVTVREMEDVRDAIEGIGDIVQRHKTRLQANNGRFAGIERRLKAIESYLEATPVPVLEEVEEEEVAEEALEDYNRENALQAVRRAGNGGLTTP